MVDIKLNEDGIMTQFMVLQTNLILVPLIASAAKFTLLFAAESIIKQMYILLLIVSSKIICQLINQRPM